MSHITGEFLGTVSGLCIKFPENLAEAEQQVSGEFMPRSSIKFLGSFQRMRLESCIKFPESSQIVLDIDFLRDLSLP